MPIYSLQAPDGKIYDLEAPEGFSENQLSAALFSLVPEAANPPKKTSAGFNVGDIARSAGSGVAGGLQALAGVAGANNPVSEYLGDISKSLQEGLTPERKAEIKARQEKIAAAEKTGSIWEQIKAGAGAVGEAPLQFVASAAGSMVTPIAAGAAAVALAPEALVGYLGANVLGIATQATVGAAMGSGQSKQDIFDRVKKEYMDAKVPEAEASKKAMLAQNWVGKNLDQIIINAGTGAFEAATGVGRVLAPGKAAKAVAKTPSLLKTVGTVGLEEAVPETLQSLSGTAATNIAATREGFEAPTFQGAAAPAAESALTAFLAGAATGPKEYLNKRGEFEARQKPEVEAAPPEVVPPDTSSSDYAKNIATQYQEAEARKSELLAQLREIQKNSATETADRLHNAAIEERVKAMTPELEQLATEYNKVLPSIPVAEPVEEVAAMKPEQVAAKKPTMTVGDALDDPIGRFSKDELISRSPKIAQYVDSVRKKQGKPEIDSYSIEDIRNAMPNQLPEAEKADLNSLIAAKTGYVGGMKYDPQDVIKVAQQKNIDTTTTGFKYFLQRATGDNDLANMSQPQLHSAFKELAELPKFEEPQILPEKTNATIYNPEQYTSAVSALQGLVAKRDAAISQEQAKLKEGQQPKLKPVSVEEAQSLIKKTAKLKSDDDIRTLFQDANRKGDIDLTSEGNVTLQAKGPQAEFSIEEGAAPAEKTGFNVMRGDRRLYFTENEEEANAKAASLGKSSAPAVAQIEKAIAKENASIAAGQRALSAMESNGLFNTPQYQQASARQDSVVANAAQNIKRLNEQKDRLQQPVAVNPTGKVGNKKVFTVKEPGVSQKSFDTREEAEKHVLENLPAKRLNELAAQTKAPGFANRLKKEQERRKNPPKPFLAEKPEVKKEPEVKQEPKVNPKAEELKGELLPMLRKFGLGDVALKIEEGMKDEGSYVASTIKVALDSNNPIRVLRHESIHGLKDLGFFTPGQWKVLENQADKVWIDKYLKRRNIDGQPLESGQQSRFEAYQNLYNNDMDAIREEAIADAFADFDVNGAPKGLFATLLEAMRKFFRGLRSALTGSGYETSDDVFGKVERGELKAAKAAKAEEAKPSLTAKKEEKADPNDASRVVTDGPYADAAVRTMSSKITQTSNPLEVDDVGRLFDKAFFDEFKRKGDWKNETDFKRAVNQAVTELKYQLQQAKSGLDWYEQDIAEAFKQTQEYIPSLKKPEKRALFSVVAGIMSPSVNARDNWVIAALAYQHYEKTGILPGNNPATGGLWQGGLESANKKKQLDMLNAMLQPASKGGLGEKGAVEWLQGDHTVAEITDLRQKYGGMGKSSTGGKASDILPGFTAFGPKVGPFVMNINGIHDVTVDVWMTRTFNRYFGQMMGPDDKMLRAPTEPQRVAIKKLAIDAAEQVGIKPYQVQSTLWFFEQQLFNKLGTGAKSYGFSDGANKFAESQSGAGAAKGVTANVGANAPANKPAGKQAVGTGAQTNQPATGQQGLKPSIRSGVIAEVAPNPDQEIANKWRNMSPADKLRTTTAVANKTVGKVLDELGLKGYTFEVSSGRYEGETNPNVLVHAPKDASIEELSELSKTLGYVLDQKAMVSYDEDNTTSDSQAGFVKVGIPKGMSDADLARLREHIAQKVPQADSDTLREKSLLYGNFSEYNDKVATITDEQYHEAILKAIDSFEYDGAIEVSRPERFHSELAWPDSREAYLEGTRYGTGNSYGSTEGADVRRSGRRNLDNISQEAISLRNRWIESTARPEQPAVRPSGGGDEGITLGEQQDGAVSFQGTHYGKNATPILLGRMSGTGIKGAEQTRLANSTDSRIKKRVYFYIPKPDGSMPKPESGLGNHVHTQRLNNILSPGKEMNRLSKLAGGDSNKFESNVVDAGYDGYAIPEMGMMVTLNHDVPTTYQGTVADLRSSGRLQDNQVKASLRTNTPEFKKWFGDSKVVDADGNPLVVYHGSLSKNVTEFDTTRIPQRSAKGDIAGTYFTSDPQAAYNYTREFGASIKTPRGDVTQAYLKIENPLNTTDAIKKYRKQGMSFGDAKRKALEALTPEHDGVIFDGDAANPSEYVVFKPTQIKSATGNIGTFDKTNPDIRKSLRTKTPEFKKWFGDSKIIDADGNPKVMYHGTARDITAFKPKQAGAIFLTDDPEFAGIFAGDSLEWMAKHADQFLTENQLKKGKALAVTAVRKDYGTKIDGKYIIDNIKANVYKDTAPEGQEYLRNAYKGMLPSGPNIVPVYVRAEKPFDYANPDHVRAIEAESTYGLPVNEIITGKWETIEKPRIQELIKAAGFDGFYVSEAGRKNLAVYEPTQIKSATGNEGTYDINNPDIRKSLRTNVKNDLSTMPNGAAITATMNRVTPKRQEEGFVERLVGSFAPESFSYLRQKALDRYNRLNDYDKMVAKQMGGIQLLADQSAHWAALNSDLAAGVTASALGVSDRIGGIPVLKNGYTTVSNENGTIKGAVEIFSPLAQRGDPDIYRLYQLWSAAKRGTRLLKEGRMEFLSPAEVKDALTLSQKYPEFESVQKEWIKFNNGLVKYQIDTGILSKEAGDEFMKYSDYIPFYRQMDGEATVGPSIYQSISGVKAPKKLTGKGQAPLSDFLETVVRNTQSAIQAGMKNVAAQRAVKNAQTIGMVQRLDYASSAPNVITILENGKKVSYESADKLFIDAVSSLNLPELPFLSILSKPADVLRTMVTLDPGFMLANMMRDSVSAYVTSGAKMTPIASTVKNFGNVIIGKSPEYQKLLSAGVIGGYEFSRNVEASAEALSADLRKKTGTKTGLEKALTPFTGLKGFLERGTEASDAATRIAVYKATLEETGNEAEAIRRALEVMNFNRKGSSAVVRIAAAAIPFLNARIQGLDVFFRAGIRPFLDKNATEQEKQVQKAMLIRGGTIMALSVMYAAAVAGDPDYEKQEAETKDNNWIIPSLGIRVPIPFEVGTLFKTIPERIYRYYYDKDTTKDLGDSLSRAIRSTFAINPIPQAVAPILEVRDNYSAFTQRPIVGEAMKGIAPEYQVGPGTTKMAEMLGKEIGMSPIEIDHLYKGYTGTMGMYLVDVMDSIYSLGDDNPKASKRFEQTPILKRFLVDPEARGTVSAYYDLKTSVDQVVRTVNRLTKEGNEEVGPYLEKNASLYAAKGFISDLDKQMQELQSYANMIRNAPMDKDEKRDALLEITKAQNELTKNIQEVRKAVQP